MKKIKVQYSDFWSSFDSLNNGYTRILKRKYEVEIVNESPDLLIYSVFGDTYKTINARTKLFVSGENVLPDFTQCDYSISTVNLKLQGRSLYRSFAFSSFVLSDLADLSVNEKMSERKFCCFIYSQDRLGVGAVLRAEFAKRLMEYKFVECPGRVLHNTDAPELSVRNAGDWHKSKISYINNFKFVIAFENSDNVGYITEKLMDAYKANSVPIYWGSTADLSPFPKESMICAADYPTLDALIERVKEVDANTELYMNILRANPLRNPKFIQMIKDENCKYEEFVLRVADSALALRPAFQCRNNGQMWIKDTDGDSEGIFYKTVIPRSYSIMVGSDFCGGSVVPGASDVQELRHLRSLFEAYVVEGRSTSKKDLIAHEVYLSDFTNRVYTIKDAVLALSAKVESLNTILNSVESANGECPDTRNNGDDCILKLQSRFEEVASKQEHSYARISKSIEGVYPVLHRILLGLHKRRLEFRYFGLRVKKLFLFGKSRKRIRREIHEIRLLLKECRCLISEKQ